MVTAASILVFILFNLVVIIIDMSLFHYSFLEELGNLYYISPLFGRVFLYCLLVFSFGTAIIIDVKIRKNKNKKVAK